VEQEANAGKRAATAGDADDYGARGSGAAGTSAAAGQGTRRSALAQLSPLFDEMYSAIGRASIPPERLLKASLLMALYTVRSERLFCEQLDYNLMFRWFLDMDVVEPSFDPSIFWRNRALLLGHDVTREFFTRVVAQARTMQLLSDEHFTVDGTLVEAWASLKSFKRRDREPSQRSDDSGNPTANFYGERRSNATHQSTPTPKRSWRRRARARKRSCVTRPMR